MQDVLAHYSLPELFNGCETSFWLAIAQQIAGSGELLFKVDKAFIDRSRDC
jgi:hypothetical protein